MADGTDSSQLKTSRPTFHVDGQAQPTLTGGLLLLRIAENTQGLYRCEATFGNWGPSGGGTGFLYFDRRMLDFGKPFQVRLGQAVLFDGRITALEARFPEASPPELTVLAEDRLQELRMTRRTQTYEGLSDAAVIEEVARRHSLTAQVDVRGPTYKVLAQVNQSDLAFLRERCRTLDAELWVEGSTLHAQTHEKRAGTPLVLGYHNELREFSVLADLAGQRSEVMVGGWDVRGKEALKHVATDSVLGAELDGGLSGASVLGSALGERKEVLVHTVPLNSDEARARAETFFRLSARRFLVGRGIAEPNPRLRAGARVELRGLGQLFSGKYYLTDVTVSFDGTRGLRTEFVGERPGLGKE
ncbi:phage late control D family protein [Corallococcus exiguus]|uniref:Phage late control D family protein n=1 Tax=Corallococcus exiguus TaxID=83462 RepID=A0A7X4YHH4_9BACT|nr:phage late control D family protein [Corallococcus exiguus]NBC45356.1 hypothetical protein [Corallococcus exiguus]TNV54184.1 phage late control D family protein [Corallococcus exiguus]